MQNVLHIWRTCSSDHPLVVAAGQWVKGSKPSLSGSVTRRFVGMSACFTMSALMHELVYW